MGESTQNTLNMATVNTLHRCVESLTLKNKLFMQNKLNIHDTA